jgi:hypothetical protein
MLRSNQLSYIAETGEIIAAFSGHFGTRPGGRRSCLQPLWAGRDQLWLNWAARLFTKASMPSFWSAVANSAWNRRRSNITPSDKLPS